MITNKFIHVHVPRTGGSLARHVIQRLVWACESLVMLDGRAHQPYVSMQERCQILELSPPPAFVFIRNPWSWYVSMWRWLCYTGDCNVSFEKYMEIVDSGRSADWNFRTLTYAWEYLEAGEVATVGRFENLIDDLETYLREFVPEVPMVELTEVILKCGYPKRTPGPRKPWTELYDVESINRVAAWDAGLVERFHYKEAKWSK